MQLHKHSKVLVIAETSALSLKESIGGEAAFASALHLRHKIDRKMLEKLFGEIAFMTGDRRPFAIALLLNLASAAYANPKTLLDCKDLGAMRVQPHWNPSQSYEFDKTYHQEPMNLWAGWALENVQRSRGELDVHMIKVYNTMGHGEIVSTSFNEDVDGQPFIAEVANAATSGKGITIEVEQDKRLYGASSTAEMSPLSGAHAKSRSTQQRMSKDLSGKTFNITENRARDLLNMTKNLTHAGDSHYEQLLKSLDAVGLDQTTIHETISNARKNWHAYRTELEQELSRRFQ